MKKTILFLALAMFLIVGSVAAQTYGPSANMYIEFNQGAGTFSNETQKYGSNWDNATLQSGTTWTSSKGTNGTGTYAVGIPTTAAGVTVPHSADNNVKTGSYTLAAWVRFNITTGTYVMLAKGNGNDATLDYQWRKETNGKMKLFMPGVTATDTGTAFSALTWQLAAVSVNNITNRATFYLNGVLNSNISFTPTSLYNTDTLKIGTRGSPVETGWYNGKIDQVYINKTALTTTQILNLVNNGLDPHTGVSPVNATITASDLYDGNSISNFSVRIDGQGQHFNTSTVNGTIYLANITENLLYNLTFNSSENGGYFGQVYLNVNINRQFFQANLSQAWINIYVNDSLSGLFLSSFTFNGNYSTETGTNGYILLPSKPYHQGFNISSNIYPEQSLTYSINALQNFTMTVNMSPNFFFYLKREADNSNFDVDGTNSTKLTIYCPEQNIVIYFKNATAAEGARNTTVNCPYTYMKIDVSYADSSSYFRTLIPPTNQQNVTFWLLDLNIDTGIQKIISLVDLTGDWQNGLLKIVAGIGANNEDIIEQYFDVASSVTLYLLKDAIYTVVLVNNEGTAERQLGSLIADAAGTTTITYPNIPFYPEDNTLENNITYGYSEDEANQVLRMIYSDSSHTTTSVSWVIYNGSNTNQTLQSFSSSLNNVTFSYTPYIKNQTYATELVIFSSAISFNITNKKIFGSPADILSELSGWTASEGAQLKFWIAIMFLVVWGMIFTAKFAGIGLATTYIWLVVFQWNGWISLNATTIAILGVVAVLAFISDMVKTQ